jgi:hypothetical protein
MPSAFFGAAPAVAGGTLALGIAANATVFGWIDSLLVAPVPRRGGGTRLVALETVSPNGEYSNTSYRDYRDYRDSVKSFSGLAASLRLRLWALRSSFGAIAMLASYPPARRDVGRSGGDASRGVRSRPSYKGRGPWREFCSCARWVPNRDSQPGSYGPPPASNIQVR